MRSTSRLYSRKGAVTLDWPTIVVGVLASALLAATVIRTGATGPQSQFGTHVGGLRSLSPHETLILFEDDRAGWATGALDTDHPSLGAIWLADPGISLTRDIVLPQGTTRATLSFDLIALDHWAGNGLTVALGGAMILRHRFGDAGSAPILTPTDQITLTATLGPGAAEAQSRLTVAIAVTAPGAVLPLSISADPAATTAPLWAIDNLIVVADAAP